MPKIVDHDERRREIADVVLAIIAEGGTNAVTYRSVSERSGWSTGVLGHYFTGRKDLMLGARLRAGELSAERQRVISRTMLGRQAVEGLLEEELPLDNRRLALARIFVFFYAEAAADDAIRVVIDRYLSAWIRVTAKAIESAQALRDIDPGLDPMETAADLVALADGLSIHALFDEAYMQRIQRRSPIRSWVSALAPSPARRGSAPTATTA